MTMPKERADIAQPYEIQDAIDLAYSNNVKLEALIGGFSEIRNRLFGEKPQAVSGQAEKNSVDGLLNILKEKQQETNRMLEELNMLYMEFAAL